MKAPFPYFGGKRNVAEDVWRRFGTPKQYIEPFCGSAAVLLGAPKAASLEVVGDANGYIANFWRAVKSDPDAVARWADYPISHIDLGARHKWLRARHDELCENLHDPDWPGSAKVAGWWLWGCNAWIGGGWCDVSSVQAGGSIPHVSDAGRGVQAIGQIPLAESTEPHRYDTSAGRTAHQWLRKLADRLERVRLIHGNWDRCLNHHYGGDNTAVFLDPPYLEYEGMYQSKAPVAVEAAEWARNNGNLRIALCGHVGDYDLPGWDVVQWRRVRFTMGSAKTRDQECIWYSPACIPGEDPAQAVLF